MQDHALPAILSFSECGGHAANEDVFEVRPHPDARSTLLLVLADGQGGRTGGAQAAKLACDSMMKNVGQLRPRSVMAEGSWCAALRAADDAVKTDTDAGCTTLAGLAVDGRRVVGASCGDSAVWLTTSSGVVHELTSRQFKNPALGTGGAVPVSFSSPLVGSWLIAAMSDGAWKPVGRSGVERLLQSDWGSPFLENLKAEARLSSGQFSDDFTVVVVQGRSVEMVNSSLLGRIGRWLGRLSWSRHSRNRT
jgi:hypothetical protein